MKLIKFFNGGAPANDLFPPLQDIHPNACRFGSRLRCSLLIRNSRLPQYERRLDVFQVLPPKKRLKTLPLRTRRPKRIVSMANARKILIVDDDTDLRGTLVEKVALHAESED